MAPDRNEIAATREQAYAHLTGELLPFWLERCLDEKHGGFVTHFDKDGNDTGVDEKSLIMQARCLYTLASAHRAGYGEGRCRELAERGVEFLLDKFWDETDGGFFWLCDRAGEIRIDKKILYGQSFAIYALSEYALATGDAGTGDFAERTFEIIRRRCFDPAHGGYLEMFDRQWRLAAPGPAGGDRKTLDVHMHLMEAFTALYEHIGDEEHGDALREVIDILVHRMLHPDYGTGVAQFKPDWQIASQIKFDVVWGWDRFPDEGRQAKPPDNTSFGHNLELSWLLIHAMKILGRELDECSDVLRKLIDHAVANGIDWDCGGVYVEGPHAGGVSDREKEVWQQAEALIGLLDACLLFGVDTYWPAYRNVHEFVFDKVIDHRLGEWRPLLTRDGEPIWTHLGHNWKTNYHTVRSMIQSIRRLDQLLS